MMGEIVYKERLASKWGFIPLAIAYIYFISMNLTRTDRALGYDIIFVILMLSILAVYLLRPVDVYFGKEGIRYKWLGWIWLHARDIPRDEIISISLTLFDQLKHFPFYPLYRRGRNEFKGVYYLGELVRKKGIIIRTSLKSDYLIVVRDPEAVLEKLRGYYSEKIIESGV